MTGVFYYSNGNLILQVKYSRETDTLLYSSHRKMTDSEQKHIENNIPNNMAMESRTATYYYLGVNPKLTQIFSLLSLIKPFESDMQLSEKSIDHLMERLDGTQSKGQEYPVSLSNN